MMERKFYINTGIDGHPICAREEQNDAVLSKKEILEALNYLLEENQRWAKMHSNLLDETMLEDAIDIAVQHQNTMTAAEKVNAEIQAEIDRAVRKFPTWSTDPLHALAVLGEEYGELTKAVLQLTYEPHKAGSSVGEVRKEAIQTAAMALRFVMSLDKYKYGECEQHHQGA